MKEQHPKSNPKVRCCWVCGKEGGIGFTRALRLAGYNMPDDTVAHAHPKCIAKALRKKPKETK